MSAGTSLRQAGWLHVRTRRFLLRPVKQPPPNIEKRRAAAPSLLDEGLRLLPGRRVRLAGQYLRRQPHPPLLLLDGQQFRSEEHTSELQSRRDLVCRLLLE